MSPAPLAGRRDVSCRLEFDVASPAVVVFQVAVATTAGERIDERLTVTVDGESVEPAVEEIATSLGGRLHLVRARPGALRVGYSATVDSPVIQSSDGTAGYDDEILTALRQSRYCPSDALGGFAATEFAGMRDHGDRWALAASVAEWVFERFRYLPGVSDALDTALDTIHRHEGVCRDFAHVTVALCRALGIPARLVAVYAPGLSPMDFHAVAEVHVDGSWSILDATRLAPRPALVRIATGRDAADTAFATTLAGQVEFVSSEISAVTAGDLPADDHRSPVAIG